MIATKFVDGRLGPSARGALGVLVFAGVMVLPAWGVLSAGGDVNSLMFSWFTPFAIGLALLPVHLALGRWLLGLVVRLTWLTFAGVIFIGAAMFFAGIGEVTIGQTIARIGNTWGGLVYLATLVFLSPTIIEDVRRVRG